MASTVSDPFSSLKAVGGSDTSNARPPLVVDNQVDDVVSFHSYMPTKQCDGSTVDEDHHDLDYTIRWIANDLLFMIASLLTIAAAVCLCIFISPSDRAHSARFLACATLPVRAFV